MRACLALLIAAILVAAAPAWADDSPAQPIRTVAGKRPVGGDVPITAADVGSLPCIGTCADWPTFLAQLAILVPSATDIDVRTAITDAPNGADYLELRSSRIHSSTAAGSLSMFVQNRYGLTSGQMAAIFQAAGAVRSPLQPYALPTLAQLGAAAADLSNVNAATARASLQLGPLATATTLTGIDASTAQLTLAGTTTSITLADKRSLGLAVTPQMFGAQGGGTTDDTAAFQAAVNYLAMVSPTGGLVRVPIGTYNICSVSILGNGIEIVGPGRGGRDANGALQGSTVLTPTCAGSTMLTWGSSSQSVTGGGLSGITVNAAAQNGGTGKVVAVNRGYEIHFRDDWIDQGCNGASVYGSVGTTFERWHHEGYGCVGIEFYGDATYRSDRLTLKDVDLSGSTSGGLPNSTGAGLAWHGFAHTVDAEMLRLNQVNRGVQITGDAGLTLDQSPHFGTFHNLQIDYASNDLVYIAAGEDFKFTDCYVNSSTNSNDFTVPQDTVRGGPGRVMIRGCALDGGHNAIVSFAGKSLTMSDNHVFGWNGASNSSPAVDLVSGFDEATITNNQFGITGLQTAGNGNTAYAIRVNNGSGRYIATGNTFWGTAGGVLIAGGATGASVVTNNLGP